MDWECVMDTELLKDVKRAADDGDTTLYTKKVVKRHKAESVQTVGFRNGVSFRSWELLVASIDLSSRASMLTVLNCTIIKI